MKYLYPVILFLYVLSANGSLYNDKNVIDFNLFGLRNLSYSERGNTPDVAFKLTLNRNSEALFISTTESIYNSTFGKLKLSYIGSEEIGNNKRNFPLHQLFLLKKLQNRVMSFSVGYAKKRNRELTIINNYTSQIKLDNLTNDYKYMIDTTEYFQINAFNEERLSLFTELASKFASKKYNNILWGIQAGFDFKKYKGELYREAYCEHSANSGAKLTEFTTQYFDFHKKAYMYSIKCKFYSLYKLSKLTKSHIHPVFLWELTKKHSPVGNKEIGNSFINKVYYTKRVDQFTGINDVSNKFSAHISFGNPYYESLFKKHFFSIMRSIELKIRTLDIYGELELYSFRRSNLNYWSHNDTWGKTENKWLQNELKGGIDSKTQFILFKYLYLENDFIINLCNNDFELYESVNLGLMFIVGSLVFDINYALPIYKRPFIDHRDNIMEIEPVNNSRQMFSIKVLFI